MSGHLKSGTNYYGDSEVPISRRDTNLSGRDGTDLLSRCDRTSGTQCNGYLGGYNTLSYSSFDSTFSQQTKVYVILRVPTVTFYE